MITGTRILILTGVVVNNAILIVERALQLQEKRNTTTHNAAIAYDQFYVRRHECIGYIATSCFSRARF